MGNLLYIIALVLSIIWVIGFYVYGAGDFIHVLLATAAMTLLLAIARSIESFNKYHLNN